MVVYARVPDCGKKLKSPVATESFTRSKISANCLRKHA